MDKQHARRNGNRESADRKTVVESRRDAPDERGGSTDSGIQRHLASASHSTPREFALPLIAPSVRISCTRLSRVHPFRPPKAGHLLRQTRESHGFPWMVVRVAHLLRSAYVVLPTQPLA